MKRPLTRFLDSIHPVTASGLLLVSLLSVLSGCASMNSQFDCPMASGVICKSLDEVNNMVNQGKLGKSDNWSESDSHANAFNYLSKDKCAASTYGRSSFYNQTNSYPSHFVRIWLAPYEDNAGNYYTGCTVYHRVGLESYPAHLIPHSVEDRS